ncbi:hypothetical protein BD311DRAFT_729152 [Dichomitus squalens]|uniref:F-box domain-containing protein n=1 Tax=Dichomitus squalens TaxID=114155 RepID=A0A4Q9ME63_9APHY|nr:hypothetical protein BD311DRAFT_729152 [Dichomitus squalens]
MSSSDEHKNLLHRAPSGSSTARSPALPWEVIERTIDHCSGDATMLCAFALTCRQLHPRSLFVLFKSVHLRSATQLMGFYDAVRAQPHLQPVVQSLSFPWDDFYPFPLLSILPNLRHLTFNWILSVIWDDIQLSQSCGMQSVAGLQTLTIRSARFGTRSAFLHFLSIFPNIESLTCEYVIIQSRTPLVEELDLSRPLPLRTLNVSIVMITCFLDCESLGDLTDTPTCKRRHCSAAGSHDSNSGHERNYEWGTYWYVHHSVS